MLYSTLYSCCRCNTGGLAQGHCPLAIASFSEVLTHLTGTILSSELKSKHAAQRLCVHKIVPHAARLTLYRMQQNVSAFGQVRKPPSALKRRGDPRKITPEMRVYAMELLAHRNDLWEEELAFSCGASSMFSLLNRPSVV